MNKTDLQKGAIGGGESIAKGGSQKGGLQSFSVIGIGASAGGVEATKELLANLPSETGLAFVIVQHMDPGFKSTLHEVYQAICSMPVQEVRKVVRIRPNHVYVCAPGYLITLQHGILSPSLRSKAPDVPMPIDFFFRSLAQEKKIEPLGSFYRELLLMGLRG